MEEKEYYEKFEKSLTDSLLRLCTSHKALDGMLLESEDISARWDTLAPEYLADAAGQISDFPEAAAGWAGFLGMAVAHLWDKDWQAHKDDPYTCFRGRRGFDDMDEHIVRDILGLPLSSGEAGKINSLMLACSQLCIDSIRHENIEPQSRRAFYVFVICIKTLYRIGAALELKRLGYRFEKVTLPGAGGGLMS